MSKQKLSITGLTTGTISTFTNATFALNSLEFDSRGSISKIVTGGANVSGVVGTPGSIVALTTASTSVGLATVSVNSVTTVAPSRIIIDAYGRIQSASSATNTFPAATYIVPFSITVGSSGFVSAINTSTAENITLPSLTVRGEYTVFGPLAELYNTSTGATGVVTHDFSTGNLWRHTSISSNFTANFTNVPTTDGTLINVALFLVRGTVGYIPNAVQINSSAQTIKWGAATTPSGGTSGEDVATFTFIRIGGAWTVLGNITSYR